MRPPNHLVLTIVNTFASKRKMTPTPFLYCLKPNRSYVLEVQHHVLTMSLVVLALGQRLGGRLSDTESVPSCFAVVFFPPLLRKLPKCLKTSSLLPYVTFLDVGALIEMRLVAKEGVQPSI